MRHLLAQYLVSSDAADCASCYDLGSIGVAFLEFLRDLLQPKQPAHQIALDPEQLAAVGVVVEDLVSPSPEQTSKSHDHEAALIVCDPLQPSNNIARLCYRLSQLQQVVIIVLPLITDLTCSGRQLELNLTSTSTSLE